MRRCGIQTAFSKCLGDIDDSNSQTLLVDIFLTPFFKFASINFDPCKTTITLPPKYQWLYILVTKLQVFQQ